VVERIFHGKASVRRLVARFGEPGMLRACYGRPDQLWVVPAADADGGDV
jgi:hypothetical protein